MLTRQMSAWLSRRDLCRFYQTLTAATIIADTRGHRSNDCRGMRSSPKTHELALAVIAPPTAATTVPGAAHMATAKTPVENFDVKI